MPLLAHAPELLRWVSANPLYFVSGLGRGQQAALLDGLPGWIDPNAGYTTQALGALSARQWLHGQIPWWNHFSGIGMPLAAEMQCSALFLPFVLLLGAFDGVLYLKIAMQMLAGLASYALLRQLGMHRAVAMLCAVLFELNGTFVWLGHAPILPVAFLPVILLGLERARAAATAGQGGGWTILAVGLAYAFYAGFPETSVIYLLLAAAWAVWLVLSADRAARWPFARKAVSGGICAVLLSLPVIIPFLQYLRMASIGPHGGGLPGLVDTSAAASLFPTLLGPPGYDTKSVQWGTAGGFIGLPLAAIATLALVRRGRRYGLRVLLALWCALCWAKAAGLPAAVQAFESIPYFHHIWFARYAWPSCEMAVVILTACALDDWLGGAPIRTRVVAAVFAAWVFAGGWAVYLAAPAMHHVSAGHPAYSVYVAASLCVAAFMCVASAVILARQCTRASGGVLFGLLGVQALTVAMLPLAAGARHTIIDKEAVKFLQGHLGLARFYTLGPFAPNYGAFFAVASINHNMLPVPRLWIDHVRAHLDPAVADDLFTGWTPAEAAAGETRIDALRHRLDAYAALGVKYVLAAPGTQPFAASDPAAPPPQRVYADAFMDVYELANSAPYFQARGAACVVAALSRDSVRAACDAPAQLVRRELFYPGWRARMSGAELPITEADGLFQAVPLPAGSSVITYRYAPPYIGWAYACFAAGLLWLLAACFALA